MAEVFGGCGDDEYSAGNSAGMHEDYAGEAFANNGVCAVPWGLMLVHGVLQFPELWGYIEQCLWHE